MTYMSSYSVTAPFIKNPKIIIKSYSHSVGILTYFPFGKHVNLSKMKKTHIMKIACAISLGPTDPHSNTVHVETFFTSAFKDLT